MTTRAMLILLAQPRPGWFTQAACIGVDPEMFFPDRGAPVREAKAVCRSCPVCRDCLKFALSEPAERFGIWGGTSDASAATSAPDVTESGWQRREPRSRRRPAPSTRHHRRPARRHLGQRPGRAAQAHPAARPGRRGVPGGGRELAVTRHTTRVVPRAERGSPSCIAPTGSTGRTSAPSWPTSPSSRRTSAPDGRSRRRALTAGGPAGIDRRSEASA